MTLSADVISTNLLHPEKLIKTITAEKHYTLCAKKSNLHNLEYLKLYSYKSIAMKFST